MPRNERTRGSSLLDDEAEQVSIGEELFGLFDGLGEEKSLKTDKESEKMRQEQEENSAPEPISEHSIGAVSAKKGEEISQNNLEIKKVLPTFMADNARKDFQTSSFCEENPHSQTVKHVHIPGYKYPKLNLPEGRASLRSMMINVYSPKGGVGKSTISKELSLAFATTPINKKKMKVLLIDSDWEYGDITTLFGVRPRPNVTDWVTDMIADKKQSGHIPIYTRQEIRQKYIIEYSENLHILAAPADPIDAELITEEIVSTILESVRHCDYDLIVIDSANSNRARTLVPIMKSDAVVLVETLDTTTVAETSAVLTTLKTLNCNFQKIHMVLNEVPADRSLLDISVDDISSLLQFEIAAIIPKYDMMRVINNAGEAAVDMKRTPYSEAIYKLANHILPVFPCNSKSGFFSFIKRLVRKEG